MSLSPEDSLRLNVLLRQDLLAVRIDESRQLVHALTERGEAQVQLHPIGAEERYFKLIRETLSTHVLGSPGGYPVYLRRWTRMGQARDESLGRLLLLGEPEAVVAVAHASGITTEIARRAWWAMPTSETARRLLEHDSVYRAPLGRELADFLIEHLPFEQEPQAMIDTIRLALRPGLLDEAAVQGLWSRARRKNSYYVGFLFARPDSLPEPRMAHPLYPQAEERLADTPCDNPYSAQLLRLLSPAGQSFLFTSKEVLAKPNNQDVVVALLRAMERYFAPVAPRQPTEQQMESLLRRTDELVAQTPAIGVITASAAELAPLVRAMMLFAQINDRLVNPVFSQTDAVGSVMRKKLEPITRPLFDQLRLLLSER